MALLIPLPPRRTLPPGRMPLGGTLELPVWFVVVAGVLALAGLVDRLLVPTARWMLRQRANEAIEELNTRLKLRIQPFKLTRRESLIDRLVFDQELVKAVEAHAAATGEPRAVTLARVQGYAREIVPTFNAWTYFRLGTLASASTALIASSS
jgi:glycerol-3-phosphate O-acyltransferase